MSTIIDGCVRAQKEITQARTRALAKAKRTKGRPKPNLHSGEHKVMFKAEVWCCCLFFPATDKKKEALILSPKDRYLLLDQSERAVSTD